MAGLLAATLAAGQRPQDRRPRRAFPDTTSRIAILADQLPGLTANQQRAVVDRFVGTQKLTIDMSRPLRALKPDFLVLHYRLAIWQSAPNVLYVTNGQWGNDYGVVNQHEPWFWHNQQGQRVASTADQKLLMNIADVSFAKYWSDSMIAQVRAGDFDGVFADSASPNLLQAEARGEPRFAGTGVRDLKLPELQGRTYIEAWESFIATLDRDLAAQGVPLIPNTGAFITTWDSARYDLTAGVFVEGFADPGYSESDWKDSTNHVLSLAAKKKIIIVQNYLRSTDDLERRRYLLANYLLVKGDRTYLDYFSKSALEWYPEWTLDFGRPLSNPETIADLESGGLYRREYQRGLVIVNPGAAPAAAALGARLKRVEPSGGGAIEENGSVRGSIRTTQVDRIVVPAHGAELFLK
jgi:hypothetical protein